MNLTGERSGRRGWRALARVAAWALPLLVLFFLLHEAATWPDVARLTREIPDAVEAALARPAGTQQAFAPMLAILSARHETQYSRLFRS